MQEDKLWKLGMARDPQDFEVTTLNVDCAQLAGRKRHARWFGNLSWLLAEDIRFIQQIPAMRVCASELQDIVIYVRRTSALPPVW